METFNEGDRVQYTGGGKEHRFYPGYVIGYVPTVDGVDGAHPDIPCTAYVSVDFIDNADGSIENHWPRPDEIEHIPAA